MNTLNSQNIVELASGPLETEYGEFQIKVLTDGIEECTVAIKGDIKNATNVLCRIHSSCICSHVLYSIECDCSNQMRKAMSKIVDYKRGIIILLNQEGRGNGSAAHIATQELKRSGVNQGEAYKRKGFPSDNRDYKIAAKALNYLKVNSICLLSSSERKKRKLEEYGIKVDKLSSREAEVTILGSAAKNYVAYKSAGHHIGIGVDNAKFKVLVIGDLCVDYVLIHSGVNVDTLELNLPEPELGGTAVGASLAFSEKRELFPILFGRVGNDPEGKIIQDAISKRGLTALIGRDRQKRSGVCTLLYSTGEGNRIMIKSDKENANDYSLDDLEQALEIADLGENDYVFLICHFLVRAEIEHAVKLLNIVSSSQAKVVIDLVPHNMYCSITENDFAEFMRPGVFCVISWFETIARLHGLSTSKKPSESDIRILNTLNSEWLVLRYGEGGIEKEQIFKKSHGQFKSISDKDTGYRFLDPSMRKGFGDRLTADLFSKYFCNIKG